MQRRCAGALLRVDSFPGTRRVMRAALSLPEPVFGRRAFSGAAGLLAARAARAYPRHRAGHHGLERVHAAERGGVSVRVALPQRPLAPAVPPSGGRRRGVAGDDFGFGFAVAAQIPCADADCELRRPDDRRHRHRRVPVRHLSAALLDRVVQRPDPGAADRAALAHRAVSDIPSYCSRADALRIRRHDRGR